MKIASAALTLVLILGIALIPTNRVAVAQPLKETDQVVLKVEISPYWLGVHCEPVGPELKSHLRLKSGLIVRHVVNKSPAAEADLRKLDVLVQAGDTTLSDVGHLLAAVGESADQPLRVKFVRAGQPQTIEIKPGKRPQQVKLRLDELDERLEHLSIERPNLKDLPKRAFVDKDGRLLFLKPGVIVPKELADDVEMPSGVQITIEKQGDKPARIKIRRGDDSWDVTEDTVDKLPKELRGFAKKLSNDKKSWFLWRGTGEFDVFPGTESGRFQLRFDHGKLHEKAMQHADQLRKTVVRLHPKRSDADDETAKLRDEIQRLKKEVATLKKELAEKD